MAITSPGPSSSSTATCATCLRKFTIHFRRPYTELQPASFKGEFGFDWLRDEYIHPILKLDNSTYHKIYSLNRSLDIPRLKKAYIDYTKKINPYGTEYIPTFLTIFSEKFIKKKGYVNLKSEVLLDLEIHQIIGDESPIDLNDSTEIEFVSDNNNVLISYGSNSNFNKTVKCQLRDLISNGQKNKILDQANNISRKYYQKKQSIYIWSKGKGHPQDAVIQVFAIKSGVRELVGILCVKQNNNIKKAKFKIIKIIGDSNPVNILPNLNVLLREKSLNQALIDVDVDSIENFDILSMSRAGDVDAIDFINNFYNSALQNSANERSFNSARTDDFINKVMFLYEKNKKLGYKINSDKNEYTYIFCTNLASQVYDSQGNEDGSILGSATYEHESGYTNEQWGNMIVMFGPALLDEKTYLHEIGHTFKLFHVFENGQNFEFLHGFTDNIMDYDFIENISFNGAYDSPYLGSQFSLFRWQWELINSDRSAKN